LLRAAAEAKAWDAIVCRDAGEFLREAFKRCVPLVFIDLPEETAADYPSLREATQRAKQINEALMVVAGRSTTGGEEIWARSLGVWAYLNDAQHAENLEFVFAEARTALARQHLLTADPVVAAVRQDPKKTDTCVPAGRSDKRSQPPP
jgi:hypothetical protein